MPPLAVLAFGAAFILAAMDWVAVEIESKRLEYIFKPATLIAIIVAAWLLQRGPHDGWQSVFFLIGLLFSLGGDILLMLPGFRFFLAGLLAFLFAHVGYIIGLSPTLPPTASLVLFIPIFALGALLLKRIASGLMDRGRNRMLLPVAIYSLLLSLMLFSAWATLFRPEWTPTRRAIVVSGATLFYASDSLLAWDRFVSPSRLIHFLAIVTYHLGQVALAASTAFIR